MNSSEKGTIEPSTTLRDKFWNGIGSVCDAVGGLDIAVDEISVRSDRDTYSEILPVEAY